MKGAARATSAVVDFIHGVRWEDFPAEAVQLARHCVIDGLGVLLAGSATRGSEILRHQVRAAGGAPQATAFSRDPFRTSAAAAALFNGASGHALDFDDTLARLQPRPARVPGSPICIRL